MISITDASILIADDEPLARARLRRLLHQAGAENTLEARNGQEVLDHLQTLTPDLLLLDIRMPLIDGLQAASLISRQQYPAPPEIIFTTAYDQYALDAFDVAASGFLLKPVNAKKLEKALLLALQRRSLNLSQQPEKRLPCQHKSDTLLIEQENFRLFLAEDKYVTVYHKDGKALTDQSLKQLEEDFPDILIRIHRNALVNRRQITGLQKTAKGSHLLLKDVSFRPLISRRFLPGIRELISSPMKKETSAVKEK